MSFNLHLQLGQKELSLREVLRLGELRLAEMVELGLDPCCLCMDLVILAFHIVNQLYLKVVVP